MMFFIGSNLAYALVVVGVMLLLLAHINPRSAMLRVVMLICMVAAGVEFTYLKVNPWAFLGVALSPLPFFIAVRQARTHNPLLLISIFMLTVSAFFLFVDQHNRTVVSSGWAGLVSTLCGIIIWITFESMRNTEGTRISNDPDSVVGLIGKVYTTIELYSAGSVLVDGELWPARSKKAIPAGSQVRILRQDGFGLTVKKVGR